MSKPFHDFAKEAEKLSPLAVMSEQTKVMHKHNGHCCYHHVLTCPASTLRNQLFGTLTEQALGAACCCSILLQRGTDAA